MEKEKLFAEALRLSGDARAELADRLLRSLDDEESDVSAGEWAEAWADELRSRLAAIREGSAELIDGDEALRRARTALKSSQR